MQNTQVIIQNEECRRQKTIVELLPHRLPNTIDYDMKQNLFAINPLL